MQVQSESQQGRGRCKKVARAFNLKQGGNVDRSFIRASELIPVVLVRLFVSCQCGTMFGTPAERMFRWHPHEDLHVYSHPGS